MKNCPDCGVKPGEPHIDGCDIETCTHCGVQRIQCNSKKHNKHEARWGTFDNMLSDFWIENYCGKIPGREYSHCLLCTTPTNANSGIIKTPTGQEVYCVCPNGRAMARQEKIINEKKRKKHNTSISTR